MTPPHWLRGGVWNPVEDLDLPDNWRDPGAVGGREVVTLLPPLLLLLPLLVVERECGVVIGRMSANDFDASASLPRLNAGDSFEGSP